MIDLSKMTQLSGDCYMEGKIVQEIVRLNEHQICIVFTDDTYLCITGKVHDEKPVVSSRFFLDGEPMDRGPVYEEMKSSLVKRILTNDKTLIKPEYLSEYVSFPWKN